MEGWVQEGAEPPPAIPGTTRDVGELLSTPHAKEKAESREMLKIVLSSVQYLGRQGLALRGQYHKTDYGESDSNPSCNCLEQELMTNQAFSNGWRNPRTNLSHQISKMRCSVSWL